MFGHDSNRAGDVYFLQALCPIKNGIVDGMDQSYESAVRQAASDLNDMDTSPFARVPNTYMARFYVLKDVFYESKPAKEDHLKSQYLVFAADFHGDLDPWLRDMWDRSGDLFQPVFANCVAFDSVTNSDGFVEYVKKCQVDTSLPFNGSTDQPLAEQLKGLYLKQKLGEFAATHQGLAPAELKRKFELFLERVQLDNLEHPTWRAGEGDPRKVEV